MFARPALCALSVTVVATLSFSRKQVTTASADEAVLPDLARHRFIPTIPTVGVIVSDAQPEGDMRNHVSAQSAMKRHARHWSQQTDDREPCHNAVWYDVCVVGAGVLGCSVAYHLSTSTNANGSGLGKKREEERESDTEHGKSVLVVDKGTVAGEASSLAAGILECHGSLKQPSYYEHLSSESRTILVSLQDRFDVEIEFRECGSVAFATTDKEVRFLKQRYEDLVERGADGVKLLDQTEDLVAVGPFFKHTRLSYAMYSPHCGRVNPALLTRAFADVAQHAGVEFREGCAIHSIRKMLEKGKTCYELKTKDGRVIRARQVVLATGCHQLDLFTDSLGIKAPVVPVKGMIWSSESEHLGSDFETCSDDNDYDRNGLQCCVYSIATSSFWDESKLGEEHDRRLEKTQGVRQVNHAEGGERLYDHIYGRQCEDGTILFGGDRIPVFKENLDYRVEDSKVDENYQAVKHLFPAVSQKEGSYCC